MVDHHSVQSELERISDLIKKNKYEEAVCAHVWLWSNLPADMRTLSMRVRLAITLYSASKVMPTAPFYVEHADVFARNETIDALATLDDPADKLDVVSTHLTWFGIECKGGGGKWPAYVYVNHALAACQRGIDLTENELPGAHTGTLLRTTYAWIMRRTSRAEQGDWQLNRARMRAPYIADPNQKVRVYRRLAREYLCRGHPFKAIRWVVSVLPYYFSAKLWPTTKAKLFRLR